MRRDGKGAPTGKSVSFTKPSAKSGGAGFKPKRSQAEWDRLKQIQVCSICRKLGHWHDACPEKQAMITESEGEEAEHEYYDECVCEVCNTDDIFYDCEDTFVIVGAATVVTTDGPHHRDKLVLYYIC